MTEYDHTSESEAFHDALESISRGRSNQDSLDGRSYSTGVLSVDVAGGGTTNVLLQNDSTDKIYFVETRGSSGGKFYKQKLLNVTIDTAGTTLTVAKRLPSGGASTARAESDVVYSAPDYEFNQKVLGSGTGGAGTLTGAIAPTDTGIILEPGDNVVVEMENGSPSTAVDASIDVDWVEIPTEEIEELN